MFVHVCVRPSVNSCFFADLEENTNLSPWSAYGPCSKDCDYGMETRTRQCTGECCGWGSTSQSQLCNDHNCQGIYCE